MKQRDNVLVQVPQPLIHFPPFFPAQVPQKGFSHTKISEYGDLISISAPETPRVRELLVFLSALTFVRDADTELYRHRITLTIPGREWRKRAGFGRTEREKLAWEQSIKTLTGVQYDIVVGGAPSVRGAKYKKRRVPPPFRRVLLTGIFSDVVFCRESDEVTLSILNEFVTSLDITGLRVSLTHILALRGNIARLLAYILYGRHAWTGTWAQLAALSQIGDWGDLRWQKKALKKALEELERGGFRVEIGETKIKITRGKGTLGGIIAL